MTLVTESTIPRRRVPVVTLALVGLNVALFLIMVVVGAAFNVTTGANTLAGYGTAVFDNGSFDCNGDGTPDRNVISEWLGPVRHGMPLTLAGHRYHYPLSELR